MVVMGQRKRNEAGRTCHRASRFRNQSANQNLSIGRIFAALPFRRSSRIQKQFLKW